MIVELGSEGTEGRGEGPDRDFNDSTASCRQKSEVTCFFPMLLHPSPEASLNQPAFLVLLSTAITALLAASLPLRGADTGGNHVLGSRTRGVPIDTAEGGKRIVIPSISAMEILLQAGN